MIYLFNYPAKCPNQISSTITLNLDNITFIGSIRQTCDGATFPIIFSKKSITISCPSEAAELLETERIKLITTLQKHIKTS